MYIYIHMRGRERERERERETETETETEKERETESACVCVCLCGVSRRVGFQVPGSGRSGFSLQEHSEPGNTSLTSRVQVPKNRCLRKTMIEIPALKRS